MFEFELVDGKGEVMEKTPEVDFDGHSARKPKKKAYLKFTVR